MQSDRLSANWEPISQEEVKRWRRELPRGHQREYNTAFTKGLDQTESEGDVATIENRSGPPVIDDARKVVNDLKTIAIRWAKEYPDAVVKMMRASNPEAFKHRTDEEVARMITEHYETLIEEVTRDVYQDPQNRWDKGGLVDVKDGVWRP
jgi:hypothetical protein